MPSLDTERLVQEGEMVKMMVINNRERAQNRDSIVTWYLKVKIIKLNNVQLVILSSI